MGMNGCYGKNMRNIYFQLKGIGLFVFIPIIGLYLLIPTVNYIVFWFYHDWDLLYDSILKECQYFIPLLSVWWSFFLLEHYVEEPGHELLYIDRRNKWFTLFLLYIGYLILMLPLFFVYTGLFPELWWLFLKLGIINLLYLAIAYATAFLTGKIVISVLGLLLYSIYVIAEESNFLGISYYNSLILTNGEFLHEMQGFVIATIIFFIAGVIGNHMFPERNR